MSKTMTVNEDNFDELVINSSLPVMIDFWATWCGPCKMVAPIVEELAEEYAGKINVGKVDVDQNPKIASKYGIMSIPSLIVFKGGKPMTNIVGFRPKEQLKETLDSTLGQ